MAVAAVAEEAVGVDEAIGAVDEEAVGVGEAVESQRGVDEAVESQRLARPRAVFIHENVESQQKKDYRTVDVAV